MHTSEEAVLLKISGLESCKGYLSMVTLPRQRVQEVYLKCRFCAFHHFNTRNKGTVYIPEQRFSKDDPLSLPQTCQNIPHILAQLR